jgi:hypothetical protein
MSVSMVTLLLFCRQMSLYSRTLVIAFKTQMGNPGELSYLQILHLVTSAKIVVM